MNDCNFEMISTNNLKWKKQNKKPDSDIADKCYQIFPDSVFFKYVFKNRYSIIHLSL